MTTSTAYSDIQLERLTLNAKATPSQDTSKYTVSFSWRPPPNILPEYISHYTIRCYDISDAKDAYDVTKRLNSSNAALVLRNLPRDRSYSAYVTFSTTLGEGVQSDVVDFSTSAAANAGAMNDIFKNPAILAGIAACVLLIIGIIVGVLVYRRYKKNKKGRGLHGEWIAYRRDSLWTWEQVSARRNRHWESFGLILELVLDSKAADEGLHLLCVSK